jgi:hypothetical protein
VLAGPVPGGFEVRALLPADDTTRTTEDAR